MIRSSNNRRRRRVASPRSSRSPQPILQSPLRSINRRRRRMSMCRTSRACGSISCSIDGGSGGRGSGYSISFLGGGGAVDGLCQAFDYVAELGEHHGLSRPCGVGRRVRWRGALRRLGEAKARFWVKLRSCFEVNAGKRRSLATFT